MFLAKQYIRESHLKLSKATIMTVKLPRCHVSVLTAWKHFQRDEIFFYFFYHIDDICTTFQLSITLLTILKISPPRICYLARSPPLKSYIGPSARYIEYDKVD